MIKRLLTLTLILTAFVAGAQNYRPMNNYYQYNNNVRFADTVFYDTNDYSPSNGLMLTLDTVGLSTTSYSRIVSGGMNNKAPLPNNYIWKEVHQG